MKTLKLAVLMAGTVLVVCQSYGQQEFSLSYSGTYSGGTLAGSGDIWATPNGDGSFTLTSGNFDWTSGPYLASGAVVTLGTAPGGDTLANPYGTPGFSGTTYIQYGGDQVFPVDNKIFPGQPSLLTPSYGFGVNDSDGGLAFNDPSFVGSSGYAGMSFVFYADSGGTGGYGVVFDGPQYMPYLGDYDGGTVSLTAVVNSVPEPSSYALFGVGLFAFSLCQRIRSTQH